MLAYALAMTLGRGHAGWFNLALLCLAGAGAWLFLWTEARVAAPLIQPALLRESALRLGCAANALVSTVMMATLVVGPFYLAGALGLDAGGTGLAMSAGPVAAALAGMPAGRLADRHGAGRMALLGLAAMAAGCALLALAPAALGVVGYIAPLLVLTAGYALFQAANGAAVMAAAPAGHRGVVSGLLTLSRNLGLVTGASAMGAVFAWGAGAQDLLAAPPQALAAGMRATFLAGAGCPWRPCWPWPGAAPEAESSAGAQRLLVDLVGAGAGQRVQDLDHRRHLVARQVGLAMRQQRRLVRAGAGPQHHEGADDLAPVAVRPAHGGGLRHVRVQVQDFIDLARIDVVAADDHQVLLAVAYVQEAVLGEFADVAGVEPAVAQRFGGGLGRAR